MYGQGPGPLSIASDAMHRRGSNDMRFNARRSGSMTIDTLEVYLGLKYYTSLTRFKDQSNRAILSI